MKFPSSTGWKPFGKETPPADALLVIHTMDDEVVFGFYQSGKFVSEDGPVTPMYWTALIMPPIEGPEIH